MSSSGIAAGAEFLATYADTHGQGRIQAAVVPDKDPSAWLPTKGDRIRIDLGDGTDPILRTIEHAIPQEDGSYAITFTAESTT
jgi:hypothetical protein